MTCTKDYIIGDLHGSYSRLEVLLEHVKFDPARDRLYSVGDLTDRGPESLKCLELLDRPWFHCVMSNHEQMFLHAHTGGPMGFFWRQNGGGWHLPEDKRYLLDKVAALPKIISTGDFHVIHAELHATKPITDEDIKNNFDAMATVFTEDGEYVLWAREMFYYFYGLELTPRNLKKARTYLRLNKLEQLFASEELNPIYCGHTTVTHPLKLGKLRNLDTGAYRSYWRTTSSYNQTPQAPSAWAALTMTCHQTGQVWQAKESGVTETTFYDCVSQ